MIITNPPKEQIAFYSQSQQLQKCLNIHPSSFHWCFISSIQCTLSLALFYESFFQRCFSFLYLFHYLSICGKSIFGFLDLRQISFHFEEKHTRSRILLLWMISELFCCLNEVLDIFWASFSKLVWFSVLKYHSRMCGIGLYHCWTQEKIWISFKSFGLSRSCFPWHFVESCVTHSLGNLQVCNNKTKSLSWHFVEDVNGITCCSFFFSRSLQIHRSHSVVWFACWEVVLLKQNLQSNSESVSCLSHTLSTRLLL
jgi:hypothetical protein